MWLSPGELVARVSGDRWRSRWLDVLDVVGTDVVLDVADQSVAGADGRRADDDAAKGALLLGVSRVWLPGETAGERSVRGIEREDDAELGAGIGEVSAS